jgi:hypothetical protein
VSYGLNYNQQRGETDSKEEFLGKISWKRKDLAPAFYSQLHVSFCVLKKKTGRFSPIL